MAGAPVRRSHQSGRRMGMAGQRRSQLRRHGARGRARRRGLFLLFPLMLAAACGDPSGPPSGLPGGSMGGGASSDGAMDEALIGAWQPVLVIRLADDLQTWTTTWRFAGAGPCRQTVVTESLAEGFPRT